MALLTLTAFLSTASQPRTDRQKTFACTSPFHLQAYGLMILLNSTLTSPKLLYSICESLIHRFRFFAPPRKALLAVYLPPVPDLNCLNRCRRKTLSCLTSVCLNMLLRFSRCRAEIKRFNFPSLFVGADDEQRIRKLCLVSTYFDISCHPYDEAGDGKL